MELAVYSINGNKTSRTVSLNDSIFGMEPNDHAIWLAVKQFQANQRQGTHATLEKSMISGTTKKFKRQKGTGGARAGSMKSPLFVGGARAFGPQPRDYNFKLNKKTKDLARKSALSYKAKEDKIKVLEDFTFEEAKTRHFASLLQSMEVQGDKVLLVLAQPDKNIILASRNLQKAQVVCADSLNTYDILNASSLLMTENSVTEIEKMLAK
jgi:large subunit ribosomal protein L4